MADGRVLGALGAPTLGVGVAPGLLWVFQRRLIYFPLLHDLPPVHTRLPGAEEVVFETRDGVRLGGWFLAGGRAPGPAVLVFNGNAGDRSYRALLAAALARQGWSVLLFDYRGYAGNPGSPSEAGLLADARAALADMGRPHVGPASAERRGLLVGRAMGVRAEGGSTTDSRARPTDEPEVPPAVWTSDRQPKQVGGASTYPRAHFPAGCRPPPTCPTRPWCCRCGPRRGLEPWATQPASVRNSGWMGGDPG